MEMAAETAAEVSVFSLVVEASLILQVAEDLVESQALMEMLAGREMVAEASPEALLLVAEASPEALVAEASPEALLLVAEASPEALLLVMVAEALTGVK